MNCEETTVQEGMELRTRNKTLLTLVLRVWKLNDHLFVILKSSLIVTKTHSSTEVTPFSVHSLLNIKWQPGITRHLRSNKKYLKSL